MKIIMKKILLSLFLLVGNFIVVPLVDAATVSQVNGLNVIATTQTSIQLQWDIVKRATSYRIRVMDSEGKKVRAIKTKKINAIIDDLIAETTYQFKVRVVRGKKHGRWSDTIEAQTAAVVEEEPTAQTVDVAIENFSFSLASVTIHVGDTVRWTDRDSASHTVTSDDAMFESSNTLNNTTYEVTFEKVGTYNYHCTPHSFMTGTVVVEE